MSRRNRNNGYQRSNNTDLRSNFSRPTFTVHIDLGEKGQIEKWVKTKDHIETGGDLFGLWINAHTAVVQFVLGPGKNCRRSTVSFYQDIDYLSEAGNFLTEKHGLCNIGQWHSHHRLSLTRPSGGDEHTVWGNMPNLGLNRYIVFIATINGHGENTKVTINPYLFEIDLKGNQLPVASGKLLVQNHQNAPFRRNKVIVDFIKKGQENTEKFYTSEQKIFLNFPKFEIKFFTPKN